MSRRLRVQAIGASSAVALLMIFTASQSEASIVKTTYSFEASNFRNIWPGSTSLPPFGSFSGSFTVDIDTDYIYQNSKEAVVLDSLSNFALGSQLSLSLDTTPISGKPELMLSVGGFEGGTNGEGLFDNDFILNVVITDPAKPRFDSFSYVTETSDGAFFTETGAVTLSAVPLPATLPLYGGALLGLAAAGWHKHRGSRPDAARAIG